jgi:sulfate permease, SulP family
MAVLIALTSTLLMPIFENLPLAILGAIVISAVMGFINVPAMRRVRYLRKDSFVFALLALIGVLVLGVLPGLLLSIVLSILLLLGRESRPSGSVLGNLPGTRAFVDVQKNPEAVVEPKILIYRLDYPLMFINASWMRESLRERVRAADPSPLIVILDMQFSHELDIQGLDKLTRIEAELRESGIELWLANVHFHVDEMLRRGEVTTKIGEDHIFRTLDEAFEAAKSASLAGA